MSEAPYSSTLRTAVVLTGTGTAGAYHAGVLRALHEAGVRVDLLAGRGVGALGAMFAAIDGGTRLWDTQGFWRRAGVQTLYGWRPRLKSAGWAIAAAAACLALPIALLLGIAAMYLVGWLLALAGGAGASAAVSAAAGRMLTALFDPAALPTVVPRLAMLAVIVAVLILAGAAWNARRNRGRHEVTGWASLTGAPIDAAPVVSRATSAIWELIRGAAPIAAPAPREISRKYAEMLAENVGQPGFRELLIVAHDLDARRDLTFALLSEGQRVRFFGRRTARTEHTDAMIDLAATGRDHALDALAAALTLPLASDPHVIAFAPEAYWRGESHRLCDRPSALARLLEEAAAAGVEQVILVSAAPALEGPHSLTPARGDARGRGNELLVSSETAAVRDAQAAASGAGLFPGGIFQIRPSHNPLGPLDFGGCYDARSDRHQSVAELIDRGYEDAYRQFIEPIVGATGEPVDRTVSRPS
jgi:hypothetical protein